MQNGKKSLTALMASFSRAYHSKNNSAKIFDDFLAESLLTPEEYEAIAQNLINGADFFGGTSIKDFSEAEKLRWIVQTQLAPTPLARACYCEEALLNEIKIGCKQYVMLGAGMDTFAFRHKELLERIKVFELDHPDTQTFKMERIHLAEWDLPEGLTVVPVDFNREDFSDHLIRFGYDRTKKTFFSWLGVTYYLSKKNISNMLKTLSEISSEGSALVFDYADENLFDSKIPRVNHMVGMAKGAGEPMQSCFTYTELEKILADSGFLIYEHLSPEEIGERFFRSREDDYKAFEHIHYVLVVRKG
ncbi:MAG TPA: class I SAM-dependent methyltransferase [Thermotogota bacterium]|nr:class I SAM-dependent methyltransferase [Thermotogota bacterium]HPR97130.1 class I SAM-dependent methyltransferase [Thermotogota bacterium]